MQTFLPLPNFEESMACLDYHRLGKQRMESLEILVILDCTKPTWMSDSWYSRCQRHRNHPAVTMWSNHYEALVEYGVAACVEWRQRGYRDNMLGRIAGMSWGDEFVLPWWFGMEDFHSRHRAALLHKNPNHYRQFGWTERPMTPVNGSFNYYWPAAIETSTVR